MRGIFLKLDKDYTGCSSCDAWKTCHSCPITHYMVNKDLALPLKENGYCNICKAENYHTREYLQTELADNNERKIKNLSMVLVDVAEQNAEILKLLKENKNE